LKQGAADTDLLKTTPALHFNEGNLLLSYFISKQLNTLAGNMK